MSRDIRQLTLDSFTQSPPASAAASAARQASARDTLYTRYADALEVIPALTRSLVSFQANKHTPFYRWFKYREGFSSELVGYFLNVFRPGNKKVPQLLDPFSGAGTSLTTSAKAGWHATGIELLPVGATAIRARLAAIYVDANAFLKQIVRLESFKLDRSSANGYRFPHITITDRAFSEETEEAISAFIAFLDSIDDETVRLLFHFACMSVLEDISFTRKDGQYLRWDTRSGRRFAGDFNKGTVYPFRQAITGQLHLMYEDIKRRKVNAFARQVDLIEGSSLEQLPELESNKFDLVVTSPPYCNRYDYTRTYALELAFLNHGENDIKRLRQTLLSATVENKSKKTSLADQYAKRGQTERFDLAVSAFENQAALQEVLRLLYGAKDKGELNNNNIPNLVENYFFEMGFIIYELARVLAPGGHVVMVNDNVQYHGEEVPVDLILSDFASSAGLTVKKIWVLPKGKGNSSQQMGIHGRKELRKCVYIWSKTKV